ncbi:class I SAM-dependent methyltransferase [Janibacter massiliensis]|uniref:class I SAM-dependent methyltransferase n=1 Tax=Janibacter massiliensis TaxID=2058291 RepID=UPI000D0E60A6|nr:methyltransferase domain-containing protein [Janibacter massiliensis]
MTQDTTTPLQPSDPLEAALVARGWEHAHLLEQIGNGPSAKADALRIESERQLAADWYEPPTSGKHLGPTHRAMYESPANVTRYRRTLDYFTPGERLFEIGIGRGFLATMLMRGADLGAYKGVDLVEGNVVATREMLELNGFGDRANVEVGDLYEVTRDEVEEMGATLLMCCEVIEHVPDPAAAVKTLADALPDGADLLYSVPLLGRLEGVWGHTAMFGVDRIRAMTRDAGLIPHYVEVVDNTWVFILASRSPEPSPRARAAASAARDHTAHIEPDPTRAVEIVNVSPTDLPTADSAWTKRMNVTRGDSGQSITAGSYVRNAAGLTIAGTPKGGGLTGSQYMGVAFAAPGDGRTMGVRIQLDSPDFSVLESVYVEFRKDGERVARWRWEPSARMPKSAKPTFLLKDGVKGMYFKQSPTTGSAVEADTVEVFANVAKGASAELTIVRFGWIKN